MLALTWLGTLLGAASSLQCSSTEEPKEDTGGAGSSGQGVGGKAGGTPAGGGGGESAGASGSGQGGAQISNEAGASGAVEGGGPGDSIAGDGMGGAGAGVGGLGDGGASSDAGSAGAGPEPASCLSHGFQWIDAPSGWQIAASHVYVSGNGCVVTGYLLVPNDATYAPKGVFRWTEAGGMEVLAGSETLVVSGVNQDGSIIIAWANNASTGYTWTRALGWVAEVSGRKATVISADGSARAGGCGTDACYWKNGVVDVIPPPPPAPDGTPGSHVGVNPSQISADGSTVAGEAILWDSTHAGSVTNYVWTKAGGTKPVALVVEDHLSTGLNYNGTVLAAQRHAFTLNGAAIVATRPFLPPPTAFQNPFLWLIAMSDDATTFVGEFEPTSGTIGGQEAYIAKLGAAWSPASMADRLIAHGVQLNGDRLHAAVDTSADGKVVVGFRRTKSASG